MPANIATASSSREEVMLDSGALRIRPCHNNGGNEMTTSSRRSYTTILLAALLGIGLLAPAGRATEKPDPHLPTLFLIGDSTVNNGTKGLEGWGTDIGAFFDKTKINVENRARGGRSSRTFLTEGLWDKVLQEMKSGDFVLMQFGHNDGGSLSDPHSRASLKGNGDETKEATDADGKKETVHSYGWYLRKYISDAKAKGATPIVLSLIPRNDWKDGKVARASEGYGKWAAEAAKQEGVAFVDLNGIIADHYDKMGQEKVKAFFPEEHTHTNHAGAELNARCVIEGLKGLEKCPLCDDLLPAAAGAVSDGKQ